MPTYEYLCKACGHELEALQAMTDPALKDCPECSQPQLEKQISGGGFILKGGGWYVTDFKDPGKKQSGDKKDGTSSDGGPAACGAGACPACTD
jgi:putative FmdB family regulatory protein